MAPVSVRSDQRAGIQTPRARQPSVPTALGQEVLRSKLEASRPGPDCVRRPRLLSRLDAATGLPLTLVSAPPGFGKTTLLAQWVATRPPGSTAWVSLDADDN